MKNRDVVAFAMLLEYVIGFYILFGRDRRLKLAAVLALTMAFVWYRLGLYLFGYSTNCRCIGSMAAAFAAETPVRYVLYGILSYMGIGSIVGLWMHGLGGQNNKCVRSSRTCAILGIVCFCTVNIGQAQIASNTFLPYEVEGTLQCVFFNADKSVNTNQVYNYTVWHIKPNTWKMRSYITSEQYYELGCDGTNTYSLFYDPGDEKPAMAAHIYTDCYPLEPYPVRVPWFAYLSGAYASTNKYIPALWAVPDPLEHMFEADIKFFNRPPFFPESARWKISENRVSHAKEIMEGIYFERMPPTVRLGLSNLRRTIRQLKEQGPVWCYAVESITNYGGMSLPARYKLSIYNIEKRTGSATNANKAAAAPQGYCTNFSVEFIGIANKISSLSEVHVLPALPSNKRIDVSDGRFRSEKLNVHGIQYSITNQWIIDTMDSRLTSLAEAKYKESRKFDFSPLKAAFCAGFVCLPVLVLWLSWKATGTPKNKK
ncbi:hypothetical protein NXS98_08415 [Fontisphaera persica]|nr:hypothetical protein [Fontisphaera persica]WCJ61131.1 hypothetical protein NXS98_08415 [Fontisphaera persica]